MYLSMGSVDCPVDKKCLAWVRLYLRDCVCSMRDEVSLVMGVMSMVSWGVAEVPQIITNFREKSTDGVSLAFLMTWIIGDLFNLAGCYLEKNTLPTQLYVALLYTLTTLVLMGQTIYYDHFCKSQNRSSGAGADDQLPLQPEKEKASAIRQGKNASHRYDDDIPSSGAIYHPCSHQTSPSRQSHYISARYLASSQTPPAVSILRGAASFGSEGHDSRFLLQPSSVSGSSGIAIPIPYSAPAGKSRAALLKLVASGILFIGGFHLQTNHLSNSLTGSQQTGVFIRRKILQVSKQPRIGSFMIPIQEKGSASVVPEILGWSMAAIYMTGRLPQIWLNITRKTIEGLNPLMFMFALVGNFTYVGSILVRTTEWSKLKPNLPWLVDAEVCVLLDSFILLQCLYYYVKGRRNKVDYELLN